MPEKVFFSVSFKNGYDYLITTQIGCFRRAERTCLPKKSLSVRPPRPQHPSS